MCQELFYHQYSFVIVLSDGKCASYNMRYLAAFLCLLGITTSLAWNPPQQVQDTPEVAAAKAAHLAAIAKAKDKAREKARYASDGSWIGEKNSLKEDGSNRVWQSGWKQDQARDVTADVKSHQIEEDGSWKGDDSWKNYDDGSWEEDIIVTTEKPKPTEQRWNSQDQKWTGPVALPPGYDETGAPLPVEDTPEVAAAKAKHLLLYAQAVSRSQAAPLQASPTVSQKHSHNNAILTGPSKLKVLPAPARSAPAPHLPAPVWETNDEVVDTPEVAAAKAAHYAAHAKRRL